MTQEPSERAAAAVIRAWIEPGADGLRVRVTETLDLARPETRVNPVVSSIEDACDLVRRWLTRVVEGRAYDKATAGEAAEDRGGGNESKRAERSDPR